MSRKSLNGKHTPGPWSWRYSLSDPYGLEGADGSDIIRPVDGQVYSEYSSDSATLEISSPQDAMLIAAAPELLIALQTLLLNYGALLDLVNGDQNQRSIKKARAAISKAISATNSDRGAPNEDYLGSEEVVVPK